MQAGTDAIYSTDCEVKLFHQVVAPAGIAQEQIVHPMG